MRWSPVTFPATRGKVLARWSPVKCSDCEIYLGVLMRNLWRRRLWTYFHKWHPWWSEIERESEKWGFWNLNNLEINWVVFEEDEEMSSKVLASCPIDVGVCRSVTVKVCGCCGIFHGRRERMSRSTKRRK